MMVDKDEEVTVFALNSRDSLGRTLLHYACSNGQEGLVSVLMGFGADLTLQDEMGATPLMLAAVAVGGCGDMVNSLLASLDGCKRNECILMKDRSGRSLLHYACAGADAILVRSLVREYEADVHAVDSQNDTPLLIAAFHGTVEV